MDDIKLYITGSVGSGKSTLARLLSERLKTDCFHLDEVVHRKDETNKVWGNVRRSDEEIRRRFEEIISGKSWIVEDAGREMFEKGLKESQYIIYLKPNMFIRKWRIIKRFFRQLLGLEKCIYTPNLKMFYFMMKWSIRHDLGKDGLDNRIFKYGDKVILLKSDSDIQNKLDKLILS